MTEIAKFQIEQLNGADVATILVNDSEVLEVVRRSNGTFKLTVHNRLGDSDIWDDMSVTLKPQHFAVLGSIADMVMTKDADEMPPLQRDCR